MRAQAIRLAMIGPSGSGKSTAARELVAACAESGLRCGIYKLALPLYQLQEHFYRIAGRTLEPEAQDQALLEAVATRLRAISPTSLVDDLGRRLEQAEEDVVLNDDLRDDETDWPFMEKLGFRVVRIVTPETVRLGRLGGRGDPTVIRSSALDRQLARIPAEFVIANGASGLDGLKAQIRTLVRHITGARR